MFCSKKIIAGLTAAFVIATTGVTARNVQASVGPDSSSKHKQVENVIEMTSETREIIDAMDRALEMLKIENPSNKDKADILEKVQSAKKKFSARLKTVNRVRKEIAGMMVARGVCQDMKSALEKMDDTVGMPMRAEGEYIGDKLDAVVVSLENAMNPKLSEFIRDQSFKNAGVWLYDVKDKTMWFLFTAEKMEEVLVVAQKKDRNNALPSYGLPRP